MKIIVNMTILVKVISSLAVDCILMSTRGKGLPALVLWGHQNFEKRQALIVSLLYRPLFDRLGISTTPFQYSGFIRRVENSFLGGEENSLSYIILRQNENSDSSIFFFSFRLEGKKWSRGDIKRISLCCQPPVMGNAVIFFFFPLKTEGKLLMGNVGNTGKNLEPVAYYLKVSVLHNRGS